MEGVATAAYVVELEAPVASRVVDGLAERGWQIRRWCGAGCHRAPAFSDCPREAVPVTDALALRVLGLPLHAALTSDDIRSVVACLATVLPAQDGGAGRWGGGGGGRRHPDREWGGRSEERRAGKGR